MGIGQGIPLGGLDWRFRGPLLAALGFTGLGLGKRRKGMRETEEFYAPGGARGTLAPEAAFDWGPVVEGAEDPAALSGRLNELIQNIPYGVLRGEAAREGERRRGEMIESQTGTIEETRGIHEPVVAKSLELMETPAITQDEVNKMVATMTAGINRDLGAQARTMQSEAAGRGLSPDALAAIRQGLAGEAAFQTWGGRLGLETEAEKYNREMAQRSMMEAGQVAGQYGSQLIPQLNYATALQGMPSPIGGLADIGLTHEYGRHAALTGQQFDQANFLASLGQQAGGWIPPFGAGGGGGGGGAAGPWEQSAATAIGATGATVGTAGLLGSLGWAAPFAAKAAVVVCLDARTPIMTQRGYVPLYQVRVRDRVMTPDGWRRVIDKDLGAPRPENNSFLKITTLHNCIVLTDTHRIGNKAAGELVVGNYLQTLDGAKKIRAITKAKATLAGDLELEGGASEYVADGVFVKSMFAVEKIHGPHDNSAAQLRTRA